MPEMGRTQEYSSSLFWYEYDDGNGFTEKKRVSLSVLSSLWGPGMVDLLCRDGFKRLVLEVGRRTVILTPTIIG